MTLFEVTANMFGESYVRAYVYAETEDEARRMFEKTHGCDVVTILALFKSTDEAFVSKLSDSGFEL